MENYVEPSQHSRPPKGLLSVPHSAIGSSRPKTLPQRLSLYHTRRPSTSSPLASSQVHPDVPNAPPPASMTNLSNELRPAEQASENTFYKRLRIDVSEPVGNVSQQSEEVVEM